MLCVYLGDTHLLGLPGKSQLWVCDFADMYVMHHGGMLTCNLVEKFGTSQNEAIEIQIDNKSAIDLMKNLVYNERSKHLDIPFYFIWEQVKNEDIWMNHVASRDQAADILMKALPTELF